MLVERLRTDLTAALKAKDALSVGTLRMVLTAIREAEVAGPTQRTLSDEETQRVLAREAKKRRESATIFRDAGRPDLADREGDEAVVLEAYLPQQLSPEQLTAVVGEVLASGGFSERSQMGDAMRAVNARVHGRADGGAVAALVRARLS